jgi:hypothetical protein
VFAQTEMRSKRCRLTWRWCGRVASVASHRLSMPVVPIKLPLLLLDHPNNQADNHG